MSATYFGTLQRQARHQRCPVRQWGPGLSLIFLGALTFWVALFQFLVSVIA